MSNFVHIATVVYTNKTYQQSARTKRTTPITLCGLTHQAIEQAGEIKLMKHPKATRPIGLLAFDREQVNCEVCLLMLFSEEY